MFATFLFSFSGTSSTLHITKQQSPCRFFWRPSWCCQMLTSLCADVLLMMPMYLLFCEVMFNNCNTVHGKIMHFWLAENKVILIKHEYKVITQVQITNSAHTLSKFHQSWRSWGWGYAPFFEPQTVFCCLLTYWDSPLRLSRKQQTFQTYFRCSWFSEFDIETQDGSQLCACPSPFPSWGKFCAPFYKSSLCLFCQQSNDFPAKFDV